MNKVKNLIIDSATPIAAATTTLSIAAAIQIKSGYSLGFTNNISDAIKLVTTLSIVNILAEKYDIY